MKKVLAVIATIAIVAALTVACVANDWFGTWFGNKVDYVDQKIDDATNYDTIKKVEDTCRSMISSYESDKLTYLQYKDSTNQDEKSWSSAAMMRANKTASTYNNYILANSFVWADNIPQDIKNALEYLK